jgi:CDP-glucose 4,6-dehydratase
LAKSPPPITLPALAVDTAIEKSVEWSKVYAANGDVVKCMDMQIDEFFAE